LVLKALGTRPAGRADGETRDDLREINGVEMIDVPVHQ